MNNNCFEIIELQQGTDEWMEWRNNGIGASDAPTIMGENPYKNIKQLFLEKSNPNFRPTKNRAMLIGTQLEPEARKRYILKKSISVEPTCLQSKRNKWLRASLDGFAVSHNLVVEIKCGESVYRKTSMARSVPRYYYGQLQHILAVSGFDEIDFFCYWPIYPDLLLSVKRDNKYIESLLDKELDFWNYLNQNTKYPVLPG